MSDFGYGQKDPSDSTSKFNELMFVIRQELGRLRIMTVVEVVAVTGGGGAVGQAGTVDVLPMVNQIDGLGNAVPHGVVHGIPYYRMQAGISAVIMDPVVGDLGLALISDRDISSVIANRGQANPGSLRQFDLSDSIYLGGVLNAAPTQYVQFTSTGITISTTGSGGINLLTGAGQVSITG